MQFKELGGDLIAAIAVPCVPASSISGGGGWVAPTNLTIRSAALVWSQAVTGQATNFFTISFFNRTTGAGTVQWATAIAYSSGGVTATKATPVALTLSSTAADLQVAAGDLLAVEIAVTGTGLLAPGGVCSVTYRSR